MGTTPRHQHIVPKLLLRQFADDDLRVVMRSRSGLRKSIGIRSAAAKAHFYSYIDSTGAHDPALEHFLADEVDSPAGPAIRRLVDGTAQTPDLEAVSRFVAWQIARSPAFRHLAESAGVALGPMLAGFDAVSAWRRQHPDEPWSEEVAKLLWTEARENAPPEYQWQPDRNADIRLTIRQADKSLGELLRVRWCVAERPENVLVIGDSPAVLFKPAALVDSFGGVTVDSATQVMLPLSPRHLLLGFDSGLGGSRIPLTDDMARLSNVEQAKACQQAVFSRPDSLPLGAIVLAPVPPTLPEPSVTMAPSSGRATKIEFEPVGDPALEALIARTSDTQ